MNMNLKQKNNDSNCNFYHVSPLVPPGSLSLYPYFPWYIPPPPQPQIFFCIVGN